MNDLDRIRTIRDMLRYAETQFSSTDPLYGQNITNINAWQEAQALVLPTLHLEFHAPIEEILDANLTTKECETLFTLIQRRISERIPVSYLTHQAWFARWSFYVDERVLIPRSPFDDLIENHFKPYLESTPESILDICTGSGCIAIACAHAFPAAKVSAIDISEDALEVSKINVTKHNLKDRLTLYHSNCFDSIPCIRYDLIVTNPPYVSTQEIDKLANEYTLEPQIALAAGNDGLDIALNILRNASNYLTRKGILMMEVGGTEAKSELLQRFPSVPFKWVTHKKYSNENPIIFMLTAEQLAECQDIF